MSTEVRVRAVREKVYQGTPRLERSSSAEVRRARHTSAPVASSSSTRSADESDASFLHRARITRGERYGITNDGKCSIEIKQRIATAKRAFTQKRQLLTTQKTDYKYERKWLWNMDHQRGQDKKKLEAVKMWTRRRLLKISWTERKSNVDVLNQVGNNRNKWNNVQSPI